MPLQKHFESQGRRVLVVLQQHRLLPNRELELFFRTNRRINFVFHFRPSMMGDEAASKRYFACLSKIYPETNPVVPEHRQEALDWLQIACTSEMSTWVVAGQLPTADHLFLRELLDTNTVLLRSYDGWDKKARAKAKARRIEGADTTSEDQRVWMLSSQSPKLYWAVRGQGNFTDGFWYQTNRASPSRTALRPTMSTKAPVLELDSSDLIIPCPHLKTNPGCCFVQPPMLVQYRCKSPLLVRSYRYYDFGPGGHHDVALGEIRVQTRILGAMRRIADYLRSEDIKKYDSARGIVKHAGLLFGMLFDNLNEGDFLCIETLSQVKSSSTREKWARQIKTSLDWLHENDVIWCDARLESILVDTEGNAWLTNIGRVPYDIMESHYMPGKSKDQDGLREILRQLVPSSHEPDTHKHDKPPDTPLTSEGDDASKHDRSSDTPLTSEGEDTK